LFQKPFPIRVDRIGKGFRCSIAALSHENAFGLHIAPDNAKIKLAAGD
jgi:hypothetical protein